MPFIVAGIIAAYTDKWVKTWMPASIDIVFRSTIVVLVAILPTLFVLGPILSLFEFGMTKFIFALEGVPLGLGVGVFALLWQPLVLTGAHGAVVLALMVPLFTGGTSLMISACGIGVWAQVGVAIGIIFRTKNQKIKNILIGSIPGAIFGITEPIIYGVNLPKVKPFFLGCIVAFFGGVFSGILQVRVSVPTGQGIFAILGYANLKDQLLAFLTWIVTIAGAGVLTYFLYSERTNEVSYVKKTNKKLHTLLGKVAPTEVSAFDKEAQVIVKEIKNQKQKFVDHEKYVIEMLKIEKKVLNIENKEEKTRANLYKKAQKLLGSKTATQIQKDEAVNYYNNFNLTEQKTQYQIKRAQVDANYLEKNNQYEKMVTKFEQKTQNLVTKYTKPVSVDWLSTYENAYWNAVNTVEIGYGYKDLRNYGLSRQTRSEISNIVKTNKASKGV